eukprot:m51a1_g4099 hypothetical protein (178) ;mRNA; r:80726-83359
MRVLTTDNDMNVTFTVVIAMRVPCAVRRADASTSVRAPKREFTMEHMLRLAFPSSPALASWVQDITSLQGEVCIDRREFDPREGYWFYKWSLEDLLDREHPSDIRDGVPLLVRQLLYRIFRLMRADSYNYMKVESWDTITAHTSRITALVDIEDAVVVAVVNEHPSLLYALYTLFTP